MGRVVMETLNFAAIRCMSEWVMVDFPTPDGPEMMINMPR